MEKKSRIKFFLIGVGGLIGIMLLHDGDGFVAKEVLAISTCIILILMTTISRKIIIGNIQYIKVVKVNDDGKALDAGMLLDRADAFVIESILGFNRTAPFYINPGFSYGEFALQIRTDKRETWVYIDKNDQENIKVSKHCFGLVLNDESRDKLINIIQKNI